MLKRLPVLGLSALLSISTLSGCASLIPDQSKDYLSLSSQKLTGTLSAASASQALGAAATVSGTLTYTGQFGDISGLPTDPTKFTVNLGFVGAALETVCTAPGGITLKVNSWSIALSDPATPTPLVKSSSAALTYNAILAANGKDLTLSAQGAGTAALELSYADLKPILSSGGTNTVKASASVVLKGCSLSGSPFSLTTSDLKQTLSFK